jgi:hypothetical protein
MKKLLILLTAASALGAAPAAAQSGYQSSGYQNNAYAGGTMGMDNRIAQLDARFQAGIQSGSITRQEAQSLRPQLRQLRQLERQYSLNGLTQQERMDLQQRIRSVRQQLRMADNNSGNRWANWEDDQGYNQGYANQGYSNQGYSNQGYNGQGGPLEEVECETRSGIGGIFDSVLGRNTCVGVGSRAPSGLYAVPYEYRNQYRDGNGIYYRSDGRQIYQIDSRTNTVLRAYSMNR